MNPSPATPDHKKSRLPWKTIASSLLLLLLLLALLHSCADDWFGKGRSGHGGRGDSAGVADSLRRLDSLEQLDLLAALRAAGYPDSLLRSGRFSLSDLQRILDSLRSARIADSLLRARGLSAADSLRLLDSLRRADSLAALERARHRHCPGDGLHGNAGAGGTSSSKGTGLSRLDSLRRLTGDSVPPVVFADPAPGIHAAPVDISLIVMEPKGMPLCGSRPDSLRPCRDLIRVTSSMRLWVSGEDSIGNRAEPREMRWQIDPDASRCGTRRALVPMDDGREVCVDAYEYPNDPSVLPRTSVNWEDASSLCRNAGKRLCSNEELVHACQGPEEWRYPYGNDYALNYCQVLEGTLGRGVGRPACRSWWGAYGLIGNAWEWTSTPTPNGSSYLTAGGTYEGGPNIRCGRTSRSFFRENRYEAVGFRCCEDLAK